MPSQADSQLMQQAATALEWPVLLEHLSRHARSAMGAERCRSLPLEADLSGARARLRETAEMVALQQQGDPFPSLAFPDVRPVLARAAKDAVLEPHDLKDLSVVLGVAMDAGRYLRRRRESLPALLAAAAPLDELHAVKQAIDRCIDAEGNIRESATPELRRLMHQAQALKHKMRQRLDVILESRRYAEVLQEKYFAQRESRYVVPVKAEMRNKIPGIVHDVSASGATVFLEPRELVELNNAIKVADLEVEREVRRILQELSVLVAGSVPVLEADLEVLARLDCIAAKAGFSLLVGGRDVALNGTGRIALRQARHPLLVLAKTDVVPNDLLLDEEVRVLVISGPNTGGKTVTLKIIGLCALMVRAGLQPPCAADSEMAVFAEIYADIGDTQDLAKDLSSFSAHMTQMIRLLEQAETPGTPEARALVLIDELVTSTDPLEGAALAEALLLRFAALGMKVVVTTHYQSLKTLAQMTPGFLNASVDFDVSRLAPTYRLMMGVAGGSSALEIAGRLGLEDGILQTARQLLDQGGRGREAEIEKMLGELHDQRRRLDRDLARIGELKREQERATRESSELTERLRLSERDDRRRAKQQLTEELLKARAAVQAVLEDLKADRKLLKAKEAKARLAEVQDRAQRHLSASLTGEPPVPLEQLAAGDGVELPGLGTSGILLESPRGKKRVRVRVGDAEMSVAVALLVAQPASDAPPVSRPPVRARRPDVPSGEEAPEVLDVRGQTSEDALSLVVSALDRAVLTGGHSLRIVHGHGTGRLRDALRNYLKGSPYVAAWRAGERMEGGEGVTIVELN
jgi:DNA mismatch repair protein MutS2